MPKDPTDQMFRNIEAIRGELEASTRIAKTTSQQQTELAQQICA